MENNKDNKKKIVIIIGALTILFLLVGATYAYFSLNVTSGNTKTQVNATTTPVDNISLQKSESDLHITLRPEDMALSKLGDYYAVTDDDKNYEKEENVVSLAELTASGGVNNTAYNCEVKVTITKNTDDTMVNVLKESDAEVRLSFGDLLEDVDLFGLKTASNIVKTGHITLINNSNDFINAYLKVSNKEDYQEYLANKTLDINIDTEVIKCDAIGTSKIELALRNTNTSNTLSKHLTGGMFRYQGTATEVTDNYICFGTDNKDDCLNHQDLYMYRIIGVTPEGRLKVIKKEALDETINYWENYSDNIMFPDSNIYKAINGDKFLTNKEYMPEGWAEKIYNNIWTYGDTQYSNKTGVELYKIDTGKTNSKWHVHVESTEVGALPEKVVAGSSSHLNEIHYYKEINSIITSKFVSKVSLMYHSDYSLAINDTQICDYRSEDYSNCLTSWIHLSQNDKGALNGYEWTMSRGGWVPSMFLYVNICATTTGYLNGSGLNNSYSVRPVFYLNNDIEISGKGTTTEPYMIEL